MKLLFDENLSPRLCIELASEYPASAHVRDVGLKGASDRSIWQFASDGGFTIVSKDTDFRDQSFVSGHPPKVIWLDVGNINTAAIIAVLRLNLGAVRHFEAESDGSLLILTLGDTSL
ncbi:MAG TPA: DUF5615 family PIN-like protein [Chloroflexota bacterium]|nr:DUF5615 family PIN-like protein [Chloroflexota bacterium]